LDKRLGEKLIRILGDGIFKQSKAIAMITAVFLGFVLAALTPLLRRLGEGIFPWIYALLPLSLFIYFFSWIPGLADGAIVIGYQWIPSYGINLDFRIDGLSLLFALLITGIGTLVFFYSTYYLKGHPALDRFYGFLTMFMASMLGLVLSDNLMAMFIFWELTSISSFFLIGFNHEEKSSRKSALTALGITGFGGLVLLAGVVLLGDVGGSFSFSSLSLSSEAIQNSPHYAWIVGFFMIGAFTKSAQFPFHFWLPGAMKAPTPVSTYLHSATMVKAGIYLLARMTPVLGANPIWNDTLLWVGGITMLYAAAHSLFRVDLKSILAYSTISALGILVFLLGVGTEKALLGAGLFILAHALYKAALFLVTGIIDHQTGTRNVPDLAGLRKVMPLVAIGAAVAALSSAGFPFFLGFLSKEVMYEGVLAKGNFGFIAVAALLLTKIFLLVAGFWAGIKPFAGKLPSELSTVKSPSSVLWIPPLILAFLTVLTGAFPVLIDGSLIQPLFQAISGSSSTYTLKLWHGFNLVLLLSVITLGAGLALYFFWKPSDSKFGKTFRFESASPENIFEAGGKMVLRFSRFWTGFFQNGYLRNYFITILAFLILVTGYRLLGGVDIHIDWEQISSVSFYEVILTVMMSISIGIAVLTHSRTMAILALGVVGFVNCLFFLFFSAPDLAMTQFSIDTLTVVLFMLVLFRLPKNKRLSSNAIRIRDGVISLLFGTFIAILTLEVFESPSETDVSKYHAENAYILAKGRNVVNVILVDFRASDTIVETVVLVIAAIGVYTLMKLDLNPQKNP
jgi:multicomponent Na+:H+ antiporter subunit A